MNISILIIAVGISMVSGTTDSPDLPDPNLDAYTNSDTTESTTTTTVADTTSETTVTTTVSTTTVADTTSESTDSTTTTSTVADTTSDATDSTTTTSTVADTTTESTDSTTTTSTAADTTSDATDSTTTTSTVADTTTVSTTTTLAEITTARGEWNDWGTWSSCSSYCGTGTRYRSRSCNGNNCEGEAAESESCTGTTTECCAPKVFDLVLMIDETVSGTTYKEDFFKNVTGTFEIGSSRTRVAAVTMSYNSEIWFDFNEYTSNSAVSTVLNGISYSYYSANQAEALGIVRGELLTEAKGARSDVSDVVIMLTNSIYTTKEDDVKEAVQKLRDKGVYMIIIEKSSYNYYKLEDVADVHGTFTSSFGSSDYSSAATLVTTGFPCNYFCATSFFAYDSPSVLSTGKDTSTGTLYIMTDSPFQFTCCGVTSGWSFFAIAYGTVKMMVFRQLSENSYYLVGSSNIIVTEEYVDTTVSYSLTSSERIAVVQGDIIGWYSTGSNIVGHADCTISGCPTNNKKLSIPSSIFNAGETIDISTAETITNRAYSVKVSTSNNTELILTTIQNETEIEENTPTGYKVLYFRVTDPDLNENITWELSGDDSLFVLGELKYEQITLNLQTKLPTGGGRYVITIKGTDSCQHTASATVTVSTYNAPPIIHNLPYILEISESIKSAIHLYTINVTDATNDDICCTMSYSLPVSQNFDFRNDSGVYSIWTVSEPAFAYNDVDQYRIFICCQDPYGSSTIYLVLRLTQETTEKVVPNPGWFYRAIGVSLVPIILMTILAVSSLVYTMFFLDGDIKIESESIQNSEQEFVMPEMVTERSGVGTMGSPVTSEPNRSTVGDTIEFRNRYNDEIVNIPIWRGVGKQTTSTDGDPKWAANLREKSPDSVLKQPEQSDLSRSKEGSFGVALKLFHYGGRPNTPLNEEEKSIQVLMKKNDMKEKWKKITEKAQQKKLFKKKSGSALEKSHSSTGTEHTDQNNDLYIRESSAPLSTSFKIDVENTGDDSSTEKEIEDILSVFEEVVPTGSAAEETTLT